MRYLYAIITRIPTEKKTARTTQVVRAVLGLINQLPSFFAISISAAAQCSVVQPCHPERSAM